VEPSLLEGNDDEVDSGESSDNSRSSSTISDPLSNSSGALGDISDAQDTFVDGGWIEDELNPNGVENVERQPEVVKSTSTFAVEHGDLQEEGEIEAQGPENDDGGKCTGIADADHKGADERQAQTRAQSQKPALTLTERYRQILEDRALQEEARRELTDEEVAVKLQEQLDWEGAIQIEVEMNGGGSPYFSRYVHSYALCSYFVVGSSCVFVCLFVCW